MPEEKVLVTGEKPEGQDLGPGVTYLNPDKSAKFVGIAGVLFREGESVNLVEKLGPARAKPILQKLAGNAYFRVDGGPDHQEARQAMESRAQDEVLINDAVLREQAMRREGKQNDDIPDDLVTPSQPTLERPNLPGRTSQQPTPTKRKED